MSFDDLFGTKVDQFQRSWTSTDTLLYAVGVGCGQQDPLSELEFTTENSDGVKQRVLPSYATLLQSGQWIRHLNFEKRQWGGIDWGVPRGTVHGEQGVTLYGPLPAEGTVNVEMTLVGIYDKGSGAFVVADADVSSAETGERLATSRSGLFIRGQGGFGGASGPEDEPVWEEPDRRPDLVDTFATIPGQSLVYRLSGDRNPHCSDPNRARADGFERPIFQGLGTLGFACRALLRSLCDGDIKQFGGMSARFAKPLYPGETLETRIWRTGGGAEFQTVVDGEKIVLDRGHFSFAR